MEFFKNLCYIDDLIHAVAKFQCEVVNILVANNIIANLGHVHVVRSLL